MCVLYYVALTKRKRENLYGLVCKLDLAISFLPSFVHFKFVVVVVVVELGSHYNIISILFLFTPTLRRIFMC